MADENPSVFTRAAAEKIARATKIVLGTPNNYPPKHRRHPDPPGPRRWFGVTATPPQGSYPTPPPQTADTYPVRLLDRWFDESPGEQATEQVPWDDYITARLACNTGDKRWIPEGTNVEVWLLPTRKGHRYWFRPLDEQERLFQLKTQLDCGAQALAFLLLGPGPDQVPDFEFEVCDRVSLVGTLPGAPDYAEAGVRGIAKFFHDRGSWDIIALGQCPGSSSSSGSSSPSSGSSSSESSSGESSEESSSSSPCPDVTFNETDVKCEGGQLNVYTRSMALNFVDGCLSLTPGDWTFAHSAGCCDCGSSGSSSPSSESPSSDQPSSEEPPSPPPSSEDPPSPPPSSDQPSSEEPPSGSSGESSLAACVGNCVWVAVEDTSGSSTDGSSGDSAESSESSSCGPCATRFCDWEAVTGYYGLEWSKRSDCGTPCRCYYPMQSPAYQGQYISGECGCGCGNCAYQFDGAVWHQVADCADFADPDCNCFPQPTEGGYPAGYLLTGACG